MVWYLDALLYLWELVKTWLHTLFVTPFQTSDMLWLLVPVWLAWFFSEFFQEKTGTSLGNAMSNAVVIIWGSIDCTRQTIRFITEGVLYNSWDLVARFALIGVILTYGIVIVIFGWKGNTLIKRIGRVREVTYIFAIFVPIFYNALPFSLNHIVAALLFFPVFYYVIEWIDRYAPNPKALEEDWGGSKTKGMSETPDFGKDMNMPDFPKMPKF